MVSHLSRAVTSSAEQNEERRRESQLRRGKRGGESLKDGKKEKRRQRDRQRIVGGSGKEGRKRGKKRSEEEACKEGAEVKEGETVPPVGRYFCACFVFNFSPPFAPRRGRRDAEQRSRGWLVCGCLSSYAYLSASHIDSGRHYAS